MTRLMNQYEEKLSIFSNKVRKSDKPARPFDNDDNVDWAGPPTLSRLSLTFPDTAERMIVSGAFCVSAYSLR
jgi:hypothetical protein